jgi:hypothetical protein
MERARDPRERQAIMDEYLLTMERELYGSQMMPVPSLIYANDPLLGLVSPRPIAEPISVKPKPPLPEEHVVSALIGYRAWNAPLFVDELRSVASPSKWLPYQRFEAKCNQDQCSGVSCNCGIYAFNKMKLVQKKYTTEDRAKRYVYGECWLWGRVLECANGYRAQFGYPKAFIDDGAIAKRMSEVFGVELLKPSRLADKLPD